MSRWSELVEQYSGALSLEGPTARVAQQLCLEIDDLRQQWKPIGKGLGN